MLQRVTKALLVLMLPLACGVQAGGSGGWQWWNENWNYRLIVAVVPAGQRGGIEVAHVNLAEQSELCRPDGRDVRVLDSQGRIVPHDVRLRDNKTLDVHFFLPADVQTFYVYYGNPNAETVDYEWPATSGGGLTLETRPIGASAARADQIGEWLEKFPSVFRKQPWGQVYDLENPFGRDDLYMSIYEGVIYCPEDGQYVFAVKADDVASFEIEGLPGPLCWRDAGVPNQQWEDARHPHATCRITLRKGIYHIRYCQIENWGTQLAALGWRKPSSDAIVAVPPQAFVKYLPADIVGRQEFGQDLAPFFMAEHRYNLVVNSSDSRFPFFRFQSRSLLPGGWDRDWSYEWDFGDGSSGSGPVVYHEFDALKTYEVALTVRSAWGQQGRIVRPVSPGAGPLKYMTLEMVVESPVEMARAGRPVRLNVFLRNRGTLKRPLLLECVTEHWSAAGQERTVESSTIEDLEPTLSEDGGWLRVAKELPPPEDNLYLSLRLLLHGIPVVERRLGVLRTDRPLGELREEQGQELQDAEGRQVMLVLAHVAADDAPARRLCEEKTGKVKVLAFDEGLAGPPGPENRGSYLRLLQELLDRAYGGLHFEIERSCTNGQGGYLPIRRFVAARRELMLAKPNLVLLVCQPEAVANGVPIDAFEHYLVASLDQILTQSRAAVVVVTPPPVPGRGDLARAYAKTAKRVGLAKKVAVVDLYSRFLLTEGWPALLEAAGERHRCFQLFPNLRGQRWIAREIYASIVDALHGELSAAVRRAAYMKGASP